YDDLIQWLIIVRVYEIEEAEDALVQAMKKLPVRGTVQNDPRRSLFKTFATLATEQNKDLLVKGLERDIFPASWNKTRHNQLFYKSKFAAALVRMNDDTGRTWLLEYMKWHLDHLHQGTKDRWGRIVIGQLADAKLMEQIKDMKNEPRYKRLVFQREIDATVLQMTVNAKPIDELRAIAKNTDFDEVGKTRTQAILMLGAIGEWSDRDLLAEINNFPPQHTEANATLRQARGRALCLINARHWRPGAKD
ncbi:MAG: hypothetical protein ACPGYV_02135, partial [Phycisphaeraceae bacterium]